MEAEQCWRGRTVDWYYQQAADCLYVGIKLFNCLPKHWRLQYIQWVSQLTKGTLPKNILEGFAFEWKGVLLPSSWKPGINLIEPKHSNYFQPEAGSNRVQILTVTVLQQIFSGQFRPDVSLKTFSFLQNYWQMHWFNNGKKIFLTFFLKHSSKPEVFSVLSLMYGMWILLSPSPSACNPHTQSVSCFYLS